MASTDNTHPRWPGYQDLVQALETLRKGVSAHNTGPSPGMVFNCQRWPHCGCPDGTKATDCPGTSVPAPPSSHFTSTEDTAMRHHSAALSLDQTIQDLAEAHTLLRRAETLLSSPYDPRGDQRLGPLLRDIQSHLPPPPKPPSEGTRWRFSPSGQLLTVLGCARPTQPLVIYQYDDDVRSRATIMDLQEFLRLATLEPRP